MYPVSFGFLGEEAGFSSTRLLAVGGTYHTTHRLIHLIGGAPLECVIVPRQMCTGRLRYSPSI